MLVGSLLLGSCVTGKVASMTPLQARIPEMKFWYWKDGGYVPAYGHVADYFEAGAPKKFKIQLYNSGKCEARIIDGDTDLTRNCNGLSQLEFDLGSYGISQPSVLGISVAQEKLGIQQAYLYPRLGPPINPLEVDFRCPYQASNQNLSVCSRPAGYNFHFTAKVNTTGVGQLLYTYQCVGGSLYSEIRAITGVQAESFDLKVDGPAYCEVGLALRQNKLPVGWSNIQSRNVYLRFYDPAYIPLGVPSYTVGNSHILACAGDDYNAWTLNGQEKGSMNAGKCKKVNGPSLEVAAWDGLGRFSWINYPQNALRGSIGGNYFDFYDKAQPWVSKRLKELCGEVTQECWREKQAELARDPNWVKAVENWDVKSLSP